MEDLAFGLCAPNSQAYVLLLGSCYLKIDRQGFRLHLHGFRRKERSWPFRLALLNLSSTDARPPAQEA
jgi:hypothetical protein